MDRQHWDQSGGCNQCGGVRVLSWIFSQSWLEGCYLSTVGPPAKVAHSRPFQNRVSGAIEILDIASMFCIAMIKGGVQVMSACLDVECSSTQYKVLSVMAVLAIWFSQPTF
ncbi:hypothetical protein BSKO_12049 [Bryopsis sp. KO-2023]|nr:hypothetical protein BSKO_12049 [Bryopsis sp. KO-2023]